MKTTELLKTELEKLAPEVEWHCKLVSILDSAGIRKIEEIEIYGRDKNNKVVGPFIIRAEIFILVGVYAVAKFVQQEYQFSQGSLTKEEKRTDPKRLELEQSINPPALRKPRSHQKKKKDSSA